MATGHREFAYCLGSIEGTPFAAEATLPIRPTATAAQQNAARAGALHRRQKRCATFRAGDTAWPLLAQTLSHPVSLGRVLHQALQSFALALAAVAQRLLVVVVEPRFQPNLSAAHRRRTLLEGARAEQLEHGFAVWQQMFNGYRVQSIVRLAADQSAPGAETEQGSVLISPQLVCFPNMRC
jgi:hypothetical protein